MTECDVADLVERCLQGDDQAKAVFFTEYVNVVRCAVRRRLATAPAATSGGTVYGTEYPDARIVLRAAKGDCWLKITEMDGRLFTSRLLRKGDSLRVPNRPGLTLTVGDAGTVEIAVDGKHVPFSGNSGQVKHDVLLDPAKLLPTAN